jgi:hypothetical protein
VRFESALKQMTAAAMAPVEPDRVSGLEPPDGVSAVTQSAPPAIEISGFKVHHFLGLKTALFERRKAARMGRVQLPESEFTNNCQKPLRAGMVVSPDCARTGD